MACYDTLSLSLYLVAFFRRQFAICALIGMHALHVFLNTHVCA